MANPTIVPQSRSEQILRATIDGTPYDEPAQSRIEYLLKELKEAIEAGGGGGGSGEGIALKKIWENPNPLQQMRPGDITIPSVANHDKFIMFYAQYDSGDGANNAAAAMFLKGHPTDITWVFGSNDGAVVRRRDISIANDTTMHIGNCKTATGTTAQSNDNNANIPLVLYAIDEHAGGGGGGTVVVANPSGDPTDALIKIKIGSTIYSISGSGSSDLSADLTTAINVGGIAAGTTYLQGTPLETILKDLLDPVLYPAFTAPSATLAATGTKLLEKGATLATTFTATFNRGTITPAYGTSGYRAGEATGYSLNGDPSQVGNTWSVTVDESQTSYSASVEYAAGEQPKDSKGNDYSTPLAAGSVNTNTVSYEFVDAMWANTAAIGTVAKLSLISKSAKQRDMVFPAQTVANPEVFDIPASWTITAIQVKNDLSGAYEDASTQFTVTDVTHDDAAGNSVAYKRYTFNLGYGTGARTVRVKWN